MNDGFQRSDQRRVDAAACHAFVEAANRREPEALIALFHPDAKFRPSALIGSRSSYRGHAGVRHYFEELRPVDRDQQVRIREIRRIGSDQFVVLTEVMLESEVVSPAAVVLRVQDGKIIEATAHLTDEATLIAVGLIPSPAEPRSPHPSVRGLADDGTEGVREALS